MATSSSNTVPPEPPRSDAEERAERVAAMLDRWGDEDVSDEPEWEVEDLTPVRFRWEERRSKDQSEGS